MKFELADGTVSSLFLPTASTGNRVDQSGASTYCRRKPGIGGRDGAPHARHLSLASQQEVSTTGRLPATGRHVARMQTVAHAF